MKFVAILQKTTCLVANLYCSLSHAVKLSTPQLSDYQAMMHAMMVCLSLCCQHPSMPAVVRVYYCTVCSRSV
jgi:hypothetical protein